MNKFKVGDRVFCKEKWTERRMATVTEVHAYDITVRFDGWKYLSSRDGHTLKPDRFYTTKLGKLLAGVDTEQ